jgi:hypothetical protein
MIFEVFFTNRRKELSKWSNSDGLNLSKPENEENFGKYFQKIA